MKELECYHKAAAALIKAEESQMFGKPCYKINGKAFVCLFDGCMVFKLNDAVHAAALELKDSKLFDPAGKGRAMKEWVQVNFEHHEKWPEFAKAAMAYVSKSK